MPASDSFSAPSTPSPDKPLHNGKRLHQAMQAAMQQLADHLQASSPPASNAASPQAHANTPLTLGVALSGGADSSALLLAAVQRWPGRVQAVHVHHGLQAAADDFATHCQSLCKRLNVPLTVLHVNAQASAGESPEAKAREARYQSLAAWALASSKAPQSETPPARHGRNKPSVPPANANTPASMTSAANPSATPPRQIATVLLGHHADDQVETVLLALSRGAGVAGLAGMGPHFVRHGVRFSRPLLALSSTDIRDWLRLQGLRWIEDPSNQDPRYTRNRIRQLLPAIYGAFPGFRQTLARSAQLCAQASSLLDEQAQIDLQMVSHPDICHRASPDTTPAEAAPEAPQISLLQTLSPARQANALRLWLRSVHQTTPSQSQLHALLKQIAACRTRGHRIELRVGSGHIRRQGECLIWQSAQETPKPQTP